MSMRSSYQLSAVSGQLRERKEKTDLTFYTSLSVHREGEKTLF
jgi:hypothetical protein